MVSWVVAHTHVNAELRAEHHLRRQGYEVYLPRYAKTRRHARVVEKVARPLFPRYMFVACAPAQMRWRSITSTVGVQHLVMAGDMPLLAPDGIIAELKSREDESGLVLLARGEDFVKGAKVEVISGPFSDQTGLFECIDDNQRVSIMLDILGRQVKTRLPLEAIRAAS
jgi:transcriptional antiterminator RfaH